MEAQIGSIALPIFCIPRIDGASVTRTQIKSTYSSKWRNDTDTPLSFILEYKDEFGVLNTVADSGSTDTQINFPVPDAAYAKIITYTLMVAWIITDNTLNPPTIIEKVYLIQPLTLEVADLHQRK